MNNFNKKAAFDTTSELIKWIPVIIVVAIVISTVIIIITNYTEQTFEIDKLQQIILRQRFVYSENCLAYRGATLQPGIIDDKKFNQNNLENCFKANENLGINLNLITDTIKTVNLNENLVNKFNFCFDNKHYLCTNYTYYVLVKEDDDTKTGLLNIVMIKLK
jgi:hypothetical protein